MASFVRKNVYRHIFEDSSWTRDAHKRFLWKAVHSLKACITFTDLVYDVARDSYLIDGLSRAALDSLDALVT